MNIIDFNCNDIYCPVCMGTEKSDIEKGLEKIGLQNVTEEIPSINY